MTKDKRLEKYPKTDKFEVIDTVCLPHPYCITPKHVSYAADNNGGMLDEDSIIASEKEDGAVCDICKRLNRDKGRVILSYKEHKVALLVEVTDEKSGDEVVSNIKELNDYLFSIKSMTERDGFVGFAFKRKVM